MAKSFNKYRVQPNTDKPQVLNDPILKFFNGGFLMPAKQGGILAYPYNNNQSGYVAPRMDVGGFNTTTQTTTPPWMKAVGLGLSTNPVLGGIGGLINYFSSDDNKGKSTPSTPAKQKSIYDQMQDFYSNADRAFYRDHPNMQNVPYSGKTIKLTKGRLTGADVDTGLLDFIKKTAAKNNMDPYKLAALISRESTFGVGTGSDRAGSLQSLVSGWNVDQDYVPYQLDRFLADKKVPGVKSRSDSRGWHFWIDDQDKVNEYLRVHPNLLNQYQKKLASVKKLDKNASYFDLASQWINKPGGIRKYNPGAPAYESLYNQDLKLLQSDPEFSKYFSSKEMGGPVGIYGYRNYDNDILSNKAMGGDISIPDLNTPDWLMKYKDGGEGDDDFLKNWYTGRLQDRRYKKIAQERLNALDKINVVNATQDELNAFNNKGSRTNTIAAYDKNSNKIYINPNNPKSNSSLDHEILHALYNNAPQKLQDVIFNKNKIGKTIDLEYPETAFGTPRYDYLSQPSEIHSRLGSFRKQFNIDPRKKYTSDEMKTFMNSYKGGEDDDVQELFNIIGNDPAKLAELNDQIVRNQKSTGTDLARYGGWLQKYETGGPGPGDGKTNPPIYTDDPRKVKNYQDSLNAYNGGEDLYKFGKGIYDLVRSPINKEFRNNHTITKVDYNKVPYPGTNIYPVETYNERYSLKPASWKQKLLGDDRPNYHVDANGKAWNAYGTGWSRFKKPVQPYILQQKKSGTWKPLTPEVAKGNFWSTDPKDLINMVYKETGDPTHPYIITGAPEPKPEPKLKGKVSKVNKLPIGEPSARMRIRERQMPNISAPNVEISGPYMVGYTDFDTQQGIDRGFRSAEERDAFVEELRQRQAGNYQPSQMNISSYYDVNKRKKKAYGGGLLSRTVTCSNCGHSWEAVEGGKDPMTCHKCGGIIKMKNGGWLDQFEDGGWLEDYEEFAYGGELPTAKTGAVTNAPCPPGPTGEMMIRVDGKCVPYKSIKKPVYIANDQGDYSTKYTSLVGKYTKPGSKLPAIVGPGVVYPSYLKKAYDAYNKDGKMKQETGMVFQNGKWIKADQVQTQDQILAKHFNKKQQAAVDKYWNQQMADPRVKEFIMNDPVAYQSLRLEAYRAAGVDKYTMKTKACAAGFGYVWDDEKQTCVPISTKQKVSKEAAYRSLNPMYYREALSGVIGNSTSLTGQDATIEKILPSSGISFDRTFGKNKIPIYTDAKANTTGTVMPNQQLAHVFSDPTGKLKFVDVAYADGKSISDLNNVLTQEKQEEYVADKTLQNTLNNIHKNGLKATGTTGSDWLIKPGEFGSANNPYLKEAVKRWTVNSPGYVEGADWKLHSGNLSKLYNKGSWLSRATNTLSLGSNMAENEGYGKTGYMIPDFFRNVALGTTNDITTAARLTRGAYNKYFANPTDAVVDERGISIDSPTGIQNENAQFNKSQIGLLGAGNIPNLYFAEKDLAKSGKKFWEDPSFSGLGNMALNAVNVPFQAWLSTPLVGGFSKAGVKTAEKKGVNVLSKDYLKTVSKEGLQGTKKTVGDIIGQYEGKTLSQQIKTATGIPFRFVPQAYWGPATRLTQFPMRAFGETVAKSPFGFKAGTDVWEKTTGTNPFHFMWDPIPEKFYDPYGEEVGYDIKKTAPAKTTTVPNIPNAYKLGSDTLYNVKVGDKVYQLDTKNNPDAKELFKEIKLGSENYDPKTQLFTLPVKKEDINIYQEVLSPFIKK